MADQLQKLEKILGKIERRDDRVIPGSVSVAAAGLLSVWINQPNALALIARATEAEPGRADLAWLEL